MSFDLVKTEQLPLIPENWDYEQSIAAVKPLVYQWKNLTLQIATELWVAREKLSVSPQEAALKHGTNVPRFTWEQYCNDIGLEKRTANRWLTSVFGPVRLPSPNLPKLESQVIYADPPWAFSNSGFDQSAASIYPTLSIEDICKYTDSKGKTVKKLAREKGSVLFLWVPEALLPEGLQVVKEWGFEYKARELGIEALKRCKEARAKGNIWDHSFLPGETLE